MRGVRLELVAGTAGFALFALMAAPGITWMDPGELVAAAHDLGGAHPPGHPGYSLLGKLASLVPVGEIAFRVNLLSAFAAAVALAGVVALARALGADRCPACSAAALVAAGLCVLSPVVQSNSVRAEVYAPTAALIMWSLVAAVRFLRRPSSGDGRLVLLAGLAMGGAAAFQPAIAASAALPVAGTLAWRARRRLLRLAPPTLALGLFGLAVYAYLPIRASAKNPPLLIWGDPTSLRALLDLLGARIYRGNVAASGTGERLASLIALTGDGPGAGLVLGGLLGLGLAAFSGLHRVWLPLACAATVLFGAATQAAFNPDMAGYVLPALLVLAAGLVPLTAAVRRVLPTAWPEAVRYAAAAAVLLPVLLVSAMAPGGRARDAGFQQDDAPLAHWDATLAWMPPGPGVYFAAGDHTLFAFQYERLVAGARPDIALANAELCRDAWFVRHLDRALPELYVPFVDDALRGDIADRLAAENLHRGRPVGGDRPAIGRLPVHAAPMGRSFRLSLVPVADETAALPPPVYPGDTGARIARLAGLERGWFEAQRGRLAEAARAAGLVPPGVRFEAAARPGRPPLIAHIPALSSVFLSETWQLELLADDLAWQAGRAAPVPVASGSPPERRLHAAWRALLTALERGEPPAPALASAREVLGPGGDLDSARMLHAVGRPAAAEAALRASIAARPSEPALLLLGSLVGNQSTPEALERAAVFFARASELAPADPEPWVRLGFARAKQNRLAEARAAWERAIVLDPGRRDAAEFLDRLRAGGN